MIKPSTDSSPESRSSWYGFWGMSVPLVIALLIIGIFFLPDSFEGSSALWVFGGRLHPLLLHFPIVVILLTTLFVVAGFLHSTFSQPLLIKSMLLLGCFSAFGSIVAGYLLYASDNYSGIQVQNHLRGGVLTGLGICLTTAYFFFREKKYKNNTKSPIFLSLLLVTNGMLAYTSHVGGSLTHGQDFLTEPLTQIFPTRQVALKPAEEMLVYEDLIHTILDAKCLNCHNENKTKGDLLMTSYGNLLKSGKSGKPALIPGNPKESELLIRVHLPEDDDERMPPEGKPGLTTEEISLISLWIEVGAPQNQPLPEFLEDPAVAISFESLIPKVQQNQRRMLLEKEAFEEAASSLATLAEELNVHIERDPEAEGPFFRLRMKFPPRRFSNEELLALEPYFMNFSSVSLASADISDDELFFIAKMKNLQRLFIQKTRVDGSGLPYFHNHEHLETLSISFSPIHPGNIFHLLNIPNLKEVYVFGTPVKPEIIHALQAYRPDITFFLEEGPLFR